MLNKIVFLFSIYKNGDSITSNQDRTIADINRNCFWDNDIIFYKYISFKFIYQVKFPVDANIYFYLVDIKPQKID